MGATIVMMVLMMCSLGVPRCTSHPAVKRLFAVRAKRPVDPNLPLDPATQQDSYHKLPRLHLSDALATSTMLDLPQESSHYLLNVMRLKPGRQLRLFNGRDGEFLATMQTSTSKRSALVLVEKQLRSQATAGQGREIHLYFCPIKRPRVKLLLEKATELGVDRLVPVVTQNVNEKWDGESSGSGSGSGSGSELGQEQSPYYRTLVEAAEQSERLTVPTLEKAIGFEALLKRFQGSQGSADCGGIGGALFVCRERMPGGLSLVQALLDPSSSAAPQPVPVCLFVGPEGGFAAQELEAMDLGAASNQRSGSGGGRVVYVSLGDTVLRSETAAVAAVAIARGVLG